MNTNKWMTEARRYSKHIWCYEDLIDDHIDRSLEAALANQDVYEYVEQLGEKYGLDRCDQGWGLHHGIRFEKELVS